MKFFGKKSFSSIFYWLCTILTISIVLLLIFIAVSLIFKNYSIGSNNEISIGIPLTETFIKGDLNQFTITFFILSIAIFLLYYGLFFYLLRSIFKVFSREKVIFTNKTISYIKNFGWLNTFLPPLGIIIAYFITSKIDFEIIMQGGLLMALGIFSFFIAAIFNEGIALQEENDLTI